MLTQAMTKELFKYEDGVLIWKVRPTIGVQVGDVAGTTMNIGYICVGIKTKRFLAHRIIFLMFRGYLPKVIDHVNGIRDDNRIENLRECTQAQNCRNRKMSKNNKSGAKGVHWCKAAQKWQGTITLNYKSYYLGLFDGFKETKEKVAAARLEMHKEFANNGQEK